MEQSVEIDGPSEFTAIPYYAWAHRGSHQMAVWAARETSAARPLPAPTIAFRSTVTASGGKHREAITDQLLPHRRFDNTVPYFHWWPKKGSLEWVQFDFPEETSAAETAIHWFEDVNTGGCRIPKECRLLYREGAEWRPVEGEFSHGDAGVPVSTLKFGPLLTDGLRLEVQLEGGFSAGVVEWTAE